MLRMRSMSQAWPAKCTGRIARTFLCRPLSSASSMRAGLMLKVPGSTSTNTGRAPRQPSTSAVAVEGKGVVITSSPGQMQRARAMRKRERMFGAHVLSEFVLEAFGLGAGGDPSGAQCLEHLALLVGSDGRTMKCYLSHRVEISETAQSRRSSWFSSIRDRSKGEQGGSR